MSWTQVSVESTPATLCFKGVPPHGRQIATVGCLLLPETLLERVDNNPLEERERGCFSITAWTDDPASIPTFGLLHLECIAGRPETHWHLDGLGRPRGRRERRGPVPLLSFPVLMHLDYAVDYRPPSSRRPVAEGEWPRAYQLKWQCGVRDGDAGPVPFGMLPRDRFIYRRDRSPPPSGSSGSTQDTACSAFRPASAGAAAGGATRPDGSRAGGGPDSGGAGRRHAVSAGMRGQAGPGGGACAARQHATTLQVRWRQRPVAGTSVGSATGGACHAPCQHDAGGWGCWFRTWRRGFDTNTAGPSVGPLGVPSLRQRWDLVCGADGPCCGSHCRSPHGGCWAGA